MLNHDKQQFNSNNQIQQQFIHFSLTFAQQFCNLYPQYSYKQSHQLHSKTSFNMQNPSNRSLDNENALKTHQKSVAVVYKERRRIMQEINEKQKERRYLNASQDLPKFGSFKSETQIHQNPRKMIKTDPLSNKSIEQDHSDKPSQRIQQTSQDKKSLKPAVISQAIADRNRRIFGGLTSHLKKAGQHLQSQVQKEKQQNTKLILNKFISKEKQQRQEQEVKKKELLEVKLSKLREEKRENEQRMNKAENELLSFIVKSHYNAIGNFYLTKTEPKLFWKPRQPLEDQQKTDKLKLYAEKHLKKQQEELVEKVVGYNQVFDHGKYMTQNQRQFYSSSIKKMYLDHKNFIMTKTQPNLFWNPNKACKTLETLIADSQARLDDKSATLNAAHEDYYKSREQNLIDEHNKQFSDEENPEEEGNSLIIARKKSLNHNPPHPKPPK